MQKPLCYNQIWTGITPELRPAAESGTRKAGHMAKGKYIKDYRIVESINSRGGVRVETEYIGAPYYFLLGSETAGKSRRLSLLLCLAGWCAFIGALIPNSAGMRTMYVSLPFAFSALPLGLMSSLLLGSLRLKEPMEHRLADRFENRFPAQALAMTALPGAALSGEGIRWATGGSMLPGDAVFAPCAAALCLCGALCFGQRGRLRTRKG